MKIKMKIIKWILTARSRWALAWLTLWECLRSRVATRRRVLTSITGRKETWLWQIASKHFIALPISPLFSWWSANPQSPSATASISTLPFYQQKQDSEMLRSQRNCWIVGFFLFFRRFMNSFGSFSMNGRSKREILGIICYLIPPTPNFCQSSLLNF